MILANIDIAKTPANLALFPKLLTPSGVAVFLVHCECHPHGNSTLALIQYLAGDPSEEEGFVSLSVQEFASKLEALSAREVLVRRLSAGQSVVFARNFTPPSTVPEELTTNVVFHHFFHGNESWLVEKVNKMPAGGELWIIGSDDAAGIGALGVAAGLIAEEVLFTVRSILFEDASTSFHEREDWIHAIRRNPKILEDHLKVSAAGEVLVRRTVQGSPSTRSLDVRHIGYSKNSHGQRSVAAAYPSLPGPNEVEIVVEAFGLTELEAEAPLTAFVGSVGGKKVLGYSYQKLRDVVAIDKAAVVSLPRSVSVVDAVCLPAAVLPAWVGLVEVGRIERDSVVLVHDALSRASLLFIFKTFSLTLDSQVSGVLQFKLSRA